MYLCILLHYLVQNLKLKTKLDFLKIDNGKLGAINFNNMLPVTEKNIIKINLHKKSYLKSDTKYMILLEKQLRWLNRNYIIILSKIYLLYPTYINYCYIYFFVFS